MQGRGGGGGENHRAGPYRGSELRNELPCWARPPAMRGSVLLSLVIVSGSRARQEPGQVSAALVLHFNAAPAADLSCQ